MCPFLQCGLDVYVENGRITKVTPMPEHALKIKQLCAKPQGLVEWVYSPERVTSPMLKVNGKWKEVSWDEALGFITDKLQAIKKKYGAKAFLAYLGDPFIGTHAEKVTRRFMDLYGSPNHTTNSSFCWYGRRIAHSVTLNYGRVTVQPNYRGTKCILVWGFNPDESLHAVGAAIHTLKQRGVKLIVIDPRRIPLAKEADIHAQIRPGRDGALAMGLLNVIIQEELYDKDFVKDWTVGFDRLVEQVKEFTPERVEEITWVPADMVRDIARSYANSRPATIAQGISIEHSTNGIQATRAVTALMAICGNWDVAGGNNYSVHLMQTNLRFPDRVNEDEAIGADYPLFTQFVRESTVVPAIETMLTGKPYPIKGMVVQGSNPMLTWPNTNKLKQALATLDLLAVADLFMTETAKEANVFLPVTTFLERKTLKDFGGSGPAMAQVSEQAIEPLGNAMEDWRIWAELGKRMGYAEYFPWKDADELFEYLLQPSGLTLKQLQENPGGIFYGEHAERRYLEIGFDTPSKKVEIYSETMEKSGVEPVPTYYEPAESPLTRPELAKEYPLHLITGRRSRFFTHSQFRNIPSLRKQEPEPLLEIHPDTAHGLGISDGDMVKVSSPRGEIEIKAKVTEDILPQVVSVPHGWPEANVNVLIDHKALDPISAYPGFRCGLCKVTKSGK